MKITVFGATGRIGGELVRQGLAAGHHVTAVVRDVRRLAEQDAHLEVLEVGAVDDPGLLAEAMEGRDAVLSALGPRGPRDAGATAPMTRTILDTMDLTDVRRLVVVSAALLGPPAEGDRFIDARVLQPLVGRMLRPVCADLREMEDDLALSGQEWTAVRPPRLVDRPLTGRYRTALDANLPRGRLIGRADVAHAMLALVDDASTWRHTVGVAW